MFVKGPSKRRRVRSRLEPPVVQIVVVGAVQDRSVDLPVKNKGILILVVGLLQPPAEPDDHLWRRSSLALTAGFVGRDFLRLKALKVDGA